MHAHQGSGAKAAIAGGFLIALAGFAVGVDPGSTSVGRLTFSCDSAIPGSWLVSGTQDQSTPPPESRTGLERQVEAQCRAVVQRRRLLTWGGLGVGGFVALVGWTALREGKPETRDLALSHA